MARVTGMAETVRAAREAAARIVCLSMVRLLVWWGLGAGFGPVSGGFLVVGRMVPPVR
jgi:hypothetical protein